MNQWLFVTAAYALTLLAIAGLTGWSYAAMRRAEKKLEGLGER